MRFTIPIGELRKAPFVGPRGGLWADQKHKIHWDPKKHGASTAGEAILDPVPNDKLQEVIDKLASSAKVLAQIKAKIEEKKAAIEGRGEATPMALMRWSRAVEAAEKVIAAKPAKKGKPQLGFEFTAPVPETEAAPPIVDPIAKKIDDVRQQLGDIHPMVAAVLEGTIRSLERYRRDPENVRRPKLGRMVTRLQDVAILASGQRGFGEDADAFLAANPLRAKQENDALRAQKLLEKIVASESEVSATDPEADNSSGEKSRKPLDPMISAPAAVDELLDRLLMGATHDDLVAVLAEAKSRNPKWVAAIRTVVSPAGEFRGGKIMRQLGDAIEEAQREGTSLAQEAPTTTDLEANKEPGPEAEPHAGDGGLASEAITESEPGWDRMPASLNVKKVHTLLQSGDPLAQEAAQAFIDNADTARAKATRKNALRKLGVTKSKGEWKVKAPAEPVDAAKSQAKMGAERDKWSAKERELVGKSNTLVREFNAIKRKPSGQQLRHSIQMIGEVIAKQKAEGRHPSTYEHLNERLNRAKEQLASGKNVRTPEDETRLVTLEEEVEFLKPSIKLVRKHKNGYGKMAAQARSDFYAKSVAADSWKPNGYHSRPWELFARAFESYTHDKMESAGRKNTYLVSNWKDESDIYPKGEERKRVIAAFDGLMEHLRESGLMKKALDTIFTVPLVKALGH